MFEKMKHKQQRMFLYNCRKSIDTIPLFNCQCVATCLPSNHVWLEQKMRPLHLDVLTCFCLVTVEQVNHGVVQKCGSSKFNGISIMFPA